MASTDTPPTSPTSPAPAQWVTRSRGLLGALLLALALGLAGFVAYLIYQGGSNVINWPALYWAALVALYSLGAGLNFLQSSRPGTTAAEADDNAACTFMAWAVPTAITSILLGVFLAFVPEYRAVLGGGLRKWTESPWPVVLTLLPLIGGIVLLALLPMLVRPPKTTVLEWLTRQRTEVAVTLLVVSLVAAVVLIVGVFMERWSFFNRPLFYWSILVSFVGLVTALTLLVGEMSAPSAERERVRLLVLTFGGLVGLFTALLGLTLPFSAEYYPVFGGGLKEWRDAPWALINTATAFLLGLVLLFASLNLARGAERSSGLMRRLLYGYNVILSSVLLLLILLLVNVLAYARLTPFNVFGRAFDWTSSNLYTIKPATAAFLTKIDKPVKIYVLGTSEMASRELENLLDTCKTYNHNITSEALNRDRNPEVLNELHAEYNLPEPVGMLVLYGTGKDKVHEFIKLTDIFRSKPNANPEDPPGFIFNGEAVLMKALTYLAEGKSKPVVYVLQGHGELDLSSKEATQPNVGLGLMDDFFKEKNYELKPLRLTLEQPKIPEDVGVLLIARPTKVIPPAELDRIREFIRGIDRKKKGKLIVLTDVIADGRKFLNTGLETLLAEFGIKVSEERLLTLANPNPELLNIGPYQESVFFAGSIQTRAVRHPIGRAFLNPDNQAPFRFLDARPVEPSQPANPDAPPPPFRVETILYAPLTDVLWTETDLGNNPKEIAANLRKNQTELQKVLKRDSISVCVGVSETKAGADPRNPHAGGTEEPRMVVFGDGTWASNFNIQQDKDARALFLSCVNWLRDRPDLGTPDSGSGADRQMIQFKIKNDDVPRLLFLPGALILFAIVLLGLGVWVVRRR